MKRTVIGLLAILFLLPMGTTSCSNEKEKKMSEMKERLSTAWVSVQSAYQRRADLIPNLVNVMKGYAEHETSTFEAVTEARNKATQITIDFENLTPEKLQEFRAAQGELSQALGRLLTIQEAYPELKANENFMDLQQQLEGTENRLNQARKSYDNLAREYHNQFPDEPLLLFGGNSSELHTPELQF